MDNRDNSSVRAPYSQPHACQNNQTKLRSERAHLDTAPVVQIFRFAVPPPTGPGRAGHQRPDAMTGVKCHHLFQQ